MASSSSNSQDLCNHNKEVNIINKANMNWYYTLPSHGELGWWTWVQCYFSLNNKRLELIDLHHAGTWKIIRLLVSLSPIWQSCASQPYLWFMGPFMMAISLSSYTFPLIFFLVCMYVGQSAGHFKGSCRLCSWLESHLL